MTRGLALGLLLAIGMMACGKYGPPVRSGSARANAAAATTAAPAAAGEACEEEPKEEAP